jgi:hypothetical protein
LAQPALDFCNDFPTFKGFLFTAIIMLFVCSRLPPWICWALSGYNFVIFFIFICC